uniref:hypothetical protein n=1 Tax=uncultured Holdemanella sp. TaxID=1763549 RepID=UPI00280550DD
IISNHFIEFLDCTLETLIFYIIVDFFEMIFNPAYYLALTMYQQAGNSIVVDVLIHIMEEIIKCYPNLKEE